MYAILLYEGCVIDPGGQGLFIDWFPKGSFLKNHKKLITCYIFTHFLPFHKRETKNGYYTNFG